MRSTRKRSANRSPTRSAGSNERGGDVSPGATMPARYRLTPIPGPHTRGADVCRSRLAPGIMEAVTEAHIEADSQPEIDEIEVEPARPRKRIDKVTLALSLMIAV